MPIVIGAKRESDFTDPIGMLGDCHRRIERFLNSLLTDRHRREVGGPLTNSSSQAALATSLRYFREAAPKPQPPMKKRACSQDCPDSIAPDLQPAACREIDSPTTGSRMRRAKPPRGGTILGPIVVGQWPAVTSQDAEDLATVLTQLTALISPATPLEVRRSSPYAFAPRLFALVPTVTRSGTFLAASRRYCGARAHTLTTGQGDSRIMPNA